MTLEEYWCKGKSVLYCQIELLLIEFMLDISVFLLQTITTSLIMAFLLFK